MMVKIIRNNDFRLNILGLPVITGIQDFSLLTHISKYTIYQLSKNSHKYYKTYQIPKKNGKLRLIAQPSAKLKGLQAWILRNILDKLKVSDFCKGFEKGTSIEDNARPHIGASVIVNMDLVDFFPSVGARYIYTLFKSIGYNSLVSTILTNLCTFEDGLPQGGPCSPKLANLVAWRMDNRIQGYVGKRGITYTRYADDLSFSGFHPNKVAKIIPTIKEIVESENFNINENKTRVAGASRAKIVTGLIINETSCGIGKRKYKLLRAKIHHLSILENQENLVLLEHVKGWFAFLKSVDLKRYEKAKRYISELSKKNPDRLVGQLIKNQ